MHPDSQVARRGLGNMAVSNAYGSNIFDILIGMGLPFVIKTSIVEGSFPVATHGLVDAGVILVGLLVLYGVLLVSSGMRVTKMAGSLFLLLYAAYIGKCLVEELS